MVLDGVAPYIENKDNGYGEKAKSFALANNETEFLVKAVQGETLEDGTIAADEILGLKVTFSGEIKIIAKCGNLKLGEIVVKTEQ